MTHILKKLCRQATEYGVMNTDTRRDIFRVAQIIAIHDRQSAKPDVADICEAISYYAKASSLYVMRSICLNMTLPDYCAARGENPLLERVDSLIVAMEARGYVYVTPISYDGDYVYATWGAPRVVRMDTSS